MRSFYAFLKNLVLPAGATSGARIELIGTGPNAGVINVYNDDNVRVASLQAAGAGGLVIIPDAANGMDTVALRTDSTVDHGLLALGEEGTAPIDVAGRIDLLTFGLYDVAARFSAPMDDSTADQMQILMASEDLSSGQPPTFRIRSGADDIMRIDGGTEPTFTAFDGQHVVTSLAQFDTDISIGPHSADTDIIAFNDFGVIGGHTYAFHLHAQYELVGTGVWTIQLYVGGVIGVGTDTDRFWRMENGINAEGTADATVYWEAPSTGLEDFVIVLNEASGTATLELVAASTAKIWVTITDLGVIP